MTVKVQEVKRIGLPRPPKTRKRKRAALIVNMHPSQLEGLERRARAASMTLAEFVGALLFDPEASADGTCDHGVAVDAVGAAACVRCDHTGRPKLERLDVFPTDGIFSWRATSCTSRSTSTRARSAR